MPNRTTQETRVFVDESFAPVITVKRYHADCHDEFVVVDVQLDPAQHHGFSLFMRDLAHFESFKALFALTKVTEVA